jgi:ubiquinol-cytochrome c reductase cytochrome b subunit
MAMGMAIVVLFLLPWIDRNPIKSVRYRSLLFKINLAAFVITFVALGYLGLKPVTDLYSQLALRFTQVYFLFFFVLWAYSKSRSPGFWIGSFVVLLAGVIAYDFGFNSSEQPDLIWKTLVIPAGYLFIALLLPQFTNWDAEKQVPERVTS